MLNSNVLRFLHLVIIIKSCEFNKVFFLHRNEHLLSIHHINTPKSSVNPNSIKSLFSDFDNKSSYLPED